MNTDWFIIPFIVNLAILAYIKVNYKDYVKLILLASVEYNVSVAVYKENRNNKPKSAYLLFVVFLISSVIFIFQIFEKFSSEFLQEHFILIILFSVLTIFVLIFLNKFINYTSGKIFFQEEISNEYNHNINIFNQSLGILLFPVTVLIAFSDIPNVFVYTGIVLFLIIYLLRVVRLIKINFNKQINLLYMFLYLCTLEIIPILFIAKLIVTI